MLTRSALVLACALLAACGQQPPPASARGTGRRPACGHAARRAGHVHP